MRALNAVVPNDWAGFLHARVDAVRAQARRSTGWRAPAGGLVYTDTASDFYKANEKSRKITDLTFSLGMAIDKEGDGGRCALGRARLAGQCHGSAPHVEAVNDVAYDPDVLKDAIRDAKGSRKPIVLLLKSNNLFHASSVNYVDGLRYPHLEHVAGKPDLLTTILAARK